MMLMTKRLKKRTSNQSLPWRRLMMFLLLQSNLNLQEAALRFNLPVVRVSVMPARQRSSVQPCSRESKRLTRRPLNWYAKTPKLPTWMLRSDSTRESVSIEAVRSALILSALLVQLDHSLLVCIYPQQSILALE